MWLWASPQGRRAPDTSSRNCEISPHSRVGAAGEAATAGGSSAPVPMILTTTNLRTGLDNQIR